MTKRALINDPHDHNTNHRTRKKKINLKLAGVGFETGSGTSMN